jgi:four helix bundle protein
MQYSFTHERLDCYRLAVEVNRWFEQAVFPPGRAHIKDQGLRSSDSVVCNIAEGCARRGTAAGRNALRIALGEAGECCAVLAPGEPCGRAGAAAEATAHRRDALSAQSLSALSKSAKKTAGC